MRISDHVRRLPSAGRAYHLSLLMGLLACNASNSGGTGSTPPADGTVSKDAAKLGQDDDTADKSASISGAYLTCFVPRPKPDATAIYGGCQVRDKNGRKADLSKSRTSRFSYLTPKSPAGKSTMAVFDLSKSPKYYFHVVYKMPLPSPEALREKTGLNLANQPTARDLAAKYFLYSSPVFLPKNILLYSKVRQGASLGLTRPAITHGLPKFVELTQKATIQGSKMLIAPEIRNRVTLDPNAFGATYKQVVDTGPQQAASPGSSPQQPEEYGFNFPPVGPEDFSDASVAQEPGLPEIVVAAPNPNGGVVNPGDGDETAAAEVIGGDGAFESTEQHETVIQADSAPAPDSAPATDSVPASDEEKPWWWSR